MNEVLITDQPIDVARLATLPVDPVCGAVVLFLGTVRNHSEGKGVKGLNYTAARELAQAELDRLIAETKERWPISRAIVHHRIGEMTIGDVAVAVITSSAHRAEAFESAKWLMDEIKKRVPIWKEEAWQDGTNTWVHP